MLVAYSGPFFGNCGRPFFVFVLKDSYLITKKKILFLFLQLPIPHDAGIVVFNFSYGSTFLLILVRQFAMGDMALGILR